jgi:hypothetical protein
MSQLTLISSSGYPLKELVQTALENELRSLLSMFNSQPGQAGTKQALKSLEKILSL